MKAIDLQKAEANLWDLIDALERGEEPGFVILRNGEPVARLLPLGTAPMPEGSSGTSVTR